LTSGGSGIVPAAQAATSVAPGRGAVQGHTLMPLVYEEVHLRRAARACMRRCSAPGTDATTWADWRDGAGARIAALSEALRAGTWTPAPLRSVLITNYFGKQFTVYVPTAGDRIVHRAMRNAVEPVLEERAFRDWVSGYRPRRNRITAVSQVMAHMEAGRTIVADIDVARSSAGSTAQEVTSWLADYVTDGTFLGLFRGVLSGPPDPMVPGTGLAPLLLNLRLSRVDARLDGLAVVRFADNYCLLAATPAGAEDAFAQATEALAAEGLAPNARKSRVRGRANPEDLFLAEG
jgi:RNA-directed DNA polymerase